MSFPRYPEYKPSGVEWLGEVPAHWALARLKRCLALATDRAEHRTNPIALENIESWSGRLVPTETEFQGDGVAFEADDILFGKLRPYLAKVLLADRSGEAVGDFHVLRPEGCVLPRFAQLQILNRAFIDTVDGSTFGSKMPRASWNFLGAMPFVVPPAEEQTIIAAFLDRETGKIDAPVAEQEKLIALLREKRQAMISHAVTKGLNPDAAMKPSGIDWLGDVPAHWHVQRIKRLAQAIEQGWSPQCENYPAEGDEWAVLKVGCVNGGCFNKGENKVLPSVLEPVPTLALKAGDLLISRANTRELVGSAAAIMNDEPCLMLCDKLYRLRFDLNAVSPDLIAKYLASPGARSQIELAATGASASMVNIGQATILEMPVALPPIAEQRQILASLRTSCTRIDKLINEATQATTCLKERRCALITTAVTGKIDVRKSARAETSTKPTGA